MFLTKFCGLFFRISCVGVLPKLNCTYFGGFNFFFHFSPLDKKKCSQFFPIFRYSLFHPHLRLSPLTGCTINTMRQNIGHNITQGGHICIRNSFSPLNPNPRSKNAFHEQFSKYSRFSREFSVFLRFLQY